MMMQMNYVSRLFIKEMKKMGIVIDAAMYRVDDDKKLTFNNDYLNTAFKSFCLGFNAARKQKEGLFIIGSYEGENPKTIYLTASPRAHHSYGSASKETDRLKKIAPNKSFVVFNAVKVFSKDQEVDKSFKPKLKIV